MCVKEHMRPVAGPAMASGSADLELQFPVDISRVVSVQFPDFAKLIKDVSDFLSRAAGQSKPEDLYASFDDLAKADLLGVAHPLLDGGEGAATEQVGRVHGVAGTSQLVRESLDARCQSLRVVEQQNFSHEPLPLGTSWCARRVTG